MTRRGRSFILVCVAALAVGVGLWLGLRGPGSVAELAAWPDDVRFPVRVIDGERTYDVELTDQPPVEGHVAYEGPTIAEGEENWKALHVYRGIDLAVLIDRTVGLSRVETLTVVALDGWHKAVPAAVLDGTSPGGTLILALSVDGEPAGTWDDAPMLVFLPEDERFSNQDMLDALGPENAHLFGEQPSSTGLMVKGVAFLVVNSGNDPLPTLEDL